MTSQIDNALLKKTILGIFRETFENVDGIYLDQGTSLKETLETISAMEASQHITEKGTTIAGQVEHLRFYIRTLNDYMDGKWHEKVDWAGSWKCKTVSDSEWDGIRENLKNDYLNLITHLNSFSDWNDERRLGGALAIAIHTAYHLGAIRQIIRSVKNGGI